MFYVYVDIYINLVYILCYTSRHRHILNIFKGEQILCMTKNLELVYVKNTLIQV